MRSLRQLMQRQSCVTMSGKADAETNANARDQFQTVRCDEVLSLHSENLDLVHPGSYHLQGILLIYRPMFCSVAFLEQSWVWRFRFREILCMKTLLYGWKYFIKVRGASPIKNKQNTCLRFGNNCMMISKKSWLTAGNRKPTSVSNVLLTQPLTRTLSLCNDVSLPYFLWASWA